MQRVQNVSDAVLMSTRDVRCVRGNILNEGVRDKLIFRYFFIILHKSLEPLNSF